MFRLDDKTAIVTGSGSGIGRAIAGVFAEQGARVMILDVDDGAAKVAASEINAAAGAERAFAYGCDVTNEASVEAVFADVAASHGRIDVLVNNAGIGHVGTVETTTGSDMDRVYGVNVKGLFHCLKSGVTRMLADGKGGAIVNLASIASVIGLHDRFAYSMSKGAVLTMTLSVATDYVKRGIRCNCICPGRVHTPFVDAYLKKNYAGQEQAKFQELSAYQPIGRMGTPKEMAALVLYLCCKSAGESVGCARKTSRKAPGVCFPLSFSFDLASLASAFVLTPWFAWLVDLIWFARPCVSHMFVAVDS